jgi:hypothetical protein
LLGTLLGTRSTVDVTLVGLELDASFASTAAAFAPARPASAHRESLAAFLGRSAGARIDLAFVFHPGLQKHRGWLDRDGFPALLARGIPVVCAAYEIDEYEMERLIVEAYGYAAGAEPLVNPFFLDLSDETTVIRWGRVLWKIDAAPAPGAQVDHARLAALETLNRMVLHSMTTAIKGPAYGATVELAASTGAALRLVHVCDQRYLDMRTRDVLLLENGSLRIARRLPSEVQASYPGDEVREIERAMWAASIKERYLLDTYPKSARKGSEVTARMLAAMRRRASALFRSGR